MSKSPTTPAAAPIPAAAPVERPELEDAADDVELETELSFAPDVLPVAELLLSLVMDVCSVPVKVCQTVLEPCHAHHHIQKDVWRRKKLR